MTLRTCTSCGYLWDGATNPFCPMCNIKEWENNPGFITAKHDPTKLPYKMPDPRSVITMDFITDKSLYITTVSSKGEYFFDTKHCNFTCVLYQPFGSTAGSAVPAWYEWPTTPLDSQIVVDIFGSPHVYAENLSKINRQISVGRLVRAVVCDVPKCTNLAIPGTTKCQLH